MKKIFKAIIIAVFTLNIFVTNIYAEPQTRKIYSLDPNSVNAAAYPFLQSLSIDDDTKEVSINNINVGKMSSNKQTVSLINDSFSTSIVIDLDNLTYNATINAKIQSKHTIAFKFEIENSKYYVCYFYPDYENSSYSQKIQSVRNGDIHNFNTFTHKYGSKTESYNVQLVQSTGKVYVNSNYVGTLQSINVPIIFEWLGNDMTGTSFIIRNEDYQSFLDTYDWNTASKASPIYNRSFEGKVFATEQQDMYEASNEYLNLPSRWIQYKTSVNLWERVSGTEQSGTGSWKQVFDAQGNPVRVETVCEYNEDNRCGTNARNNFSKYWIVYGNRFNKTVENVVEQTTKDIDALAEYKNYVYTTPWIETSSYPSATGNNVAIRYSQRTATWSDWSSWANSPQTQQDRDYKYETKYQYSDYEWGGVPANVTSWTDQCTGPTWVQNSKCGQENKTCTSASACGYKYCNTPGCGVASYESCPNDKCDVLSYKVCETAACGAKVCETAACGYKSCATSSCGVKEYNTCQNAAFGYQTCTNEACGANYKTCVNSACGVASYKTCANSACGYKSCATSGCGVASYKSCQSSSCGYMSCDNAACGYKSCATSACGCSVYRSPKILGCKTYKTCANSACGYKTCTTSACGAKVCATSACGVASYKTCENSACGYKSCATSGCGVSSYKSCATSACGVSSYKSCATAACGAIVSSGAVCGVKSYNTCATSACGTKTCQHADCGYMTCDNAACGANYDSCPAPVCGVKSYVWCQHSECGAETCTSSACGTQDSHCYLYSCPTTRSTLYRYKTRTWSSWSSWINTSSSMGSNTEELEYKYEYNEGKVEYDDHPYLGQPGSSAGWYSGEMETGKKKKVFGAKLAEQKGKTNYYNEKMTMQSYTDIVNWQAAYAFDMASKAAYANISKANGLKGANYVLWSELIEKTEGSTVYKNEYNNINNAEIYQPYLYFWGAMFTPEENVLLPIGTAYGSPVFTYDTVTITASGSLIPSEEVIRRNTKVIYYDYRDPLTYYKNDLPENWEGYEYFIEEIKNSDMDSPKITVKLSGDDILAMKEWLANGGYNTLGTCEMLREFSYIFVGLDDELSAWLASGKSCKIESAKKEGDDSGITD